MGVTSNASGIKAGTVAYFAASTAPVGWVKANGAAVSRATYAALFLAIGTTYGVGDGSTTFNLPDLRGEFMRGLDDGRGVDSGRALGSVQAEGYKAHAHGNGAEVVRFVGTGGNLLISAGGSFIYYTAGGSTMSNGDAETRPRNVALLACIKY